MAESAVSFLVEQLSVLIHKEKELLGGLRKDAEYIRDELGRMRAFLRVADEKEEIDPQLKEWVNQVRDVAYDAEDVMDKFILRFGGQQAVDTDCVCGFIRRIYVSLKNLKARHQIASEMGEIQSRVKSISEGQQRYKDIYSITAQDSSSTLAKNTWYDSRGDALLLEDEDVVGIEKPKKKLVEWISSTDSGQEVISIVGTGGLGKSTLARKVYDDSLVKMRFNAHVWLNISETFKLNELLRNMIRALVDEVKKPPPQGLEAMNADEMKEFVYRFLLDKAYIIVLDDVWKLNVWEAIRYAFPRRGVRCCIMITTRFYSIANASCVESNGHVHNMEPLPQEESKKLFCKKAFLGSSCPSYLEEVVESILKRCEGLPLAIVVIGGLLATKNNIEEWNNFHRSLGDELEGDYLRRMTKLLSLSYYDLPYYLKSCFLYFSIIPMDYFVHCRKLILLWVAEGFVQPKEGKTLEEVAEDYLKELIDRSLIQVVETMGNGKPYNLRVHHLLHTIILSKSREKGFATIASGEETRWLEQSRRLAIHASIKDNEYIRGTDHLRSVLVLDTGSAVSEQSLSKLLGGCSRLQSVLEISGALLENIPDEIFKLRHLKYLSLERTNLRIIPKSIEKLQNLETLDLRYTNVIELPVQILRLQRLRHLLVYNYRFHRGYRPLENAQSFKAPYRIGCLSSLQRLSDIEAGEVDETTTVVREIGKLTQLRILSLAKLRKADGKDLCSSLENLTRLHSLYIGSIAEDEIVDMQYPISPPPPLETLKLRGQLLNVPQWIPSLHGLTTLHLKWSRIKEDPLESLQNLPSLIELELYHAYVGEGLCFRVAKFPRLKKLWILRLEGLRWVKIDKGSMPLLQELYMWDCKLLGEMPSGIEHLTNLQYVDFSDMAEGFVKKLENQKNENGDKWKLAYIPKIEIYSLIDGEWEGRRL